MPVKCGCGRMWKGGALGADETQILDQAGGRGVFFRVSGIQPVEAQPVSLCLEEQEMGVGRTTLYEKKRKKKTITVYALFLSLVYFGRVVFLSASNPVDLPNVHV